ncbi:MAG: PKD domain-containing protein [Acidobacteria bacterium]|nr:PKD domain-containing protein [Acidobacteriota bacterium]
MSKQSLKVWLVCLFVVGTAVAVSGGANLPSAAGASELQFRLLAQWYHADFSDVVLVDEYAVCAARYKGLAIIDVSDPARPVRVADLPLPGYALRLVFHEGFIFVANVLNGLQIVDVSDPLQPVLLGEYPTEHQAWAVACQENIVLLGSMDGLDVLDVSDPARPQLLWRTDVWGDVDDVSLAGDLAAVLHAGNQERLRLLDMAQPSQPVVLAEYAPDGGGMMQAKLAGDRLYVAAAAGLQVLDVSNPAQPQPVGGYAGAPGMRLSLLGDQALLTTGQDFFGETLVLDISNPAAPRRQGVMSDVCVEGAATAGGLLFLAAREDGLQVVVPAQVPDRSILIGTVFLPEDGWGMVGLRGDTLYVQKPAGGLQLVDIGDPAAPLDRGTILGSTYDAALTGDRLYTLGYDDAAEHYWLRIYGGANPLEPEFLGQMPLENYSAALNAFTDLAVMSYAEFGDEYQVMETGFYLVDTADPAHPALAHAWTWPTPDYWMADAARRGNTLYLVYLVYNQEEYAYTESGLLVLDVSDPSAPVLQSWSTDFTAAYSIRLVNEFAVITDFYQGIIILDLREADPVPAGHWPTDDPAIIQVADGTIYLANYLGFWVLEITPAGQPVRRIFRPGGAIDWRDLLVQDNLLMVLQRERLALADLDNLDLVTPTLGAWDPQWSGGWIYADDEVGYRYNASLGLCAFRFSPGKEHTLLSATAVGGRPYAVAGTAERVVAMEQSGIFWNVDYTIPSAPEVRTFSLLDLECDQLVAHEHWLYVAGENTLTILDLRDTPAPGVVGELEFSAPSAAGTRLFLEGALLIIPRRNDSLLVDVSHPAAPAVVGHVVYDDYPLDVSLKEGLYCVGTRDGGLQIWDVRDPAQPQLASVFATGSSCQSVTVGDGVAFALVDGEPVALDLTDPAAPRPLTADFPMGGEDIRRLRGWPNRLAVERPGNPEGDWYDVQWGFAPQITAFTSDFSRGTPPLTVTFQVTATDRDDEIVAYHWDFDGDGSIDRVTGQNTATVTYEQFGVYRARVQVEDQAGFVTESLIRYILVIDFHRWVF